MPFRPFDLGQVIQTAEAIKGAREQTTTERLRQKYLGQQMEGAQQQREWQAQDRERQNQDRERLMGKEKAQEVVVRSAQILQAPNPRQYIEQYEPDLVKNLTSNGVDWSNLQDDQLMEMVTAMQNKANQELGVMPAQPTLQMETIERPDGSILQRDPTTGALRQVVGRQPQEARVQAERAPAGYRFTTDGNMEAIPGGPADPARSGGPSDPNRQDQQRPLPVGALRMIQDAREGLSVSGGIDTSLRRIYDQVATGRLDLGPWRNRASAAQNWAGMSDENSRNYQMMMSSLEKLRNDSLRLNKGVQTEGDAQRAWNELLANVNDEKAVMVQLERIMEINQRAMILQQENINAIEANYGRHPSDRSLPGSGASGGWSITEVQ